MTPQERAARAIPPSYTEWDYAELLQHVATAIQHGIEAEREACARLAAVMGMPRQEHDSAFTDAEHSAARMAAGIAAAIKARTGSP